MATILVTGSLPIEQFNQLQDRCDAENRSVSAGVRIAIKFWLKHSKPTVPESKRTRRQKGDGAAMSAGTGIDYETFEALRKRCEAEAITRSVAIRRAVLFWMANSEPLINEHTMKPRKKGTGAADRR